MKKLHGLRRGVTRRPQRLCTFPLTLWHELWLILFSNLSRIKITFRKGYGYIHPSGRVNQVNYVFSIVLNWDHFWNREYMDFLESFCAQNFHKSTLLNICSQNSKFQSVNIIFSKSCPKFCKTCLEKKILSQEPLGRFLCGLAHSIEDIQKVS